MAAYFVTGNHLFSKVRIMDIRKEEIHKQMTNGQSFYEYFSPLSANNDALTMIKVYLINNML